MKHIQFIKPEECYIRSYWEAFDAIAKEKIYLAADEAFPYHETVSFVKDNIAKNIPQLFAIDTELDLCVGWCDALPKEETIGYLGMGLLPAYREQGIGTKLIEQILKLSKNYGYQTITLDVLKSNVRAIHVYEKLGFRQIHAVTEGFVCHGALIDEAVVQMSLDLK